MTSKAKEKGQQSGARPSKCLKCGRVFVSPVALGSHMYWVHKIPGNSAGSLATKRRRKEREYAEAMPMKKSAFMATELAAYGSGNGYVKQVGVGTYTRKHANVGLAEAIAALELDIAARREVIDRLRQLSGGA